MSQEAYWLSLPVGFDKEADKVIGLECHHGNHMGRDRSLHYVRSPKEGVIVVKCNTCNREFHLQRDVHP